MNAMKYSTMSNCKDAAAAQDPKPKSPLSAYNLFFQLERKRIINETDHLNLPVTREDLRDVIQAHKAKGKRPHRKSHGKIGFRELARTVAQRWKKISPEVKALLEREAQIEKEQHIQELKEWKARQEANQPQQMQVQEQQQVLQQRPEHQLVDNQGLLNMDALVKQDGQQQHTNLHALMQIRDEIEAEMNRLASATQANNLQQLQIIQAQQQQVFVPPPQQANLVLPQVQPSMVQQLQSQQQQHQQQRRPSCVGLLEEPEQTFSRNFFDTDFENKAVSNSTTMPRSASLVDLAGLCVVGDSADANIPSEEFDLIFA
mmetsp:Transcript_14426/g.31492  ORF Transcript_14426/g.31492 Transcript_14426/m.31492 type:complete len:316 (-) Transcript_14426:176-1123(-)